MRYMDIVDVRFCRFGFYRTILEENSDVVLIFRTTHICMVAYKSLILRNGRAGRFMALAVGMAVACPVKRS